MVVKTACRKVVSMVLGDLQQRPRQVGVAALRVFIFGGALRVSSLDLQGENPRSDLYWLYLAMADFCRFLVEGIV